MRILARPRPRPHDERGRPAGEELRGATMPRAGGTHLKGMRATGVGWHHAMRRGTHPAGPRLLRPLSSTTLLHPPMYEKKERGGG